MAYIKLSDQQYPITEAEIRAENPNTSFASPFAPDGYAVVFDAPQPTYDKYTVKVVEGDPVLTSKGHWEQTWNLLPLSDEELAIAQEQQANDEKLTEQKVQSALDAFARERDFDGINDAVSYIDSTNNQWSQEAARAVVLRDAAWSAYYNNTPMPALTWDDNNVDNLHLAVPNA